MNSPPPSSLHLLLSLFFSFSFLPTTFCCFSTAPPVVVTANSATPCFQAVFAFGDSLTDTGNAAQTPCGPCEIAKSLPYGETFFHRPTGRFSNGRLMVDFMCQALNMSLLYPYLECGNLEFSRGVNFAVAGTTALNATFMSQETNVTCLTPLSLENEIQWFKASKDAAAQIAGAGAVTNLVENSLFYFGEIGANDVSYWLSAKKTVEEVKGYIPMIMEQVQGSLQALMDEGARHIIVQGTFPMGCIPSYLKSMPGKVKDYDEFGCLKPYSKLSRHGNDMLKGVIANLASNNPHVRMVYFDADGAFVQILKNPHKYGITNTEGSCLDVAASLLDAAKPPFNAKDVVNVNVCSDPSKYMFWDGIHPTEAMSKALAELFLTGTFCKPHQSFLTECNMSLDEF